jgi:hypothetical protein
LTKENPICPKGKLFIEVGQNELAASTATIAIVVEIEKCPPQALRFLICRSFLPTNQKPFSSSVRSVPRVNEASGWLNKDSPQAVNTIEATCFGRRNGTSQWPKQSWI